MKKHTRKDCEVKLKCITCDEQFSLITKLEAHMKTCGRDEVEGGEGQGGGGAAEGGGEGAVEGGGGAVEGGDGEVLGDGGAEEVEEVMVDVVEAERGGLGQRYVILGAMGAEMEGSLEATLALLAAPVSCGVTGLPTIECPHCE